MANFQRTVEDIRLFLQSANMSPTQDIQDSATSYVEVARQANERLRRCKEFLNQCLRSEAIHVAESAPDLLDMVAVLDFPELPEWETFCLKNNLPSPPKLLLLVAEDLNTAYADIEPLKEHLKKLRRMALTRAPLDQRLRVMRELASLDIEANYWHDDIATFEVARHREIERDVKAAASANDRKTLRSIAKELEADDWIQPPAATLIKGVKKHLQRITRKSGRDLLEFLCPQIVNAMHDQDIKRVEQLRTEWKQAAREARLKPDDDLQSQVDVAFHWLDSEKRNAADTAKYDRALGQLTGELEKGLSAAPEKLARFRQSVAALGYGIPEEVEDHYRATVQGIEEAANQSRRAFIIKIVVLVLLVVGFLFGAVVIAIYSMRGEKDVTLRTSSFVVGNAVPGVPRLLTGADRHRGRSLRIF